VLQRKIATEIEKARDFTLRVWCYQINGKGLLCLLLFFLLFSEQLQSSAWRGRSYMKYKWSSLETSNCESMIRLILHLTYLLLFQVFWFPCYEPSSYCTMVVQLWVWSSLGVSTSLFFGLELNFTFVLALMLKEGKSWQTWLLWLRIVCSVTW
jgi:hypothetical protein